MSDPHQQLMTSHIPLIFPYLTIREEIAVRRVKSSWYRIKIGEMGSMRQLNFKCSINCKNEHITDQLDHPFFHSPILRAYTHSFTSHTNRAGMTTLTHYLPKLARIFIKLAPNPPSPDSNFVSEPDESVPWLFPSNLIQAKLFWTRADSVLSNESLLTAPLSGLLIYVPNLQDLSLLLRLKTGLLDFEAIFSAVAQLHHLTKFELIFLEVHYGVLTNGTVWSQLPPLPTSLTNLHFDVPSPEAQTFIWSHLAASKLVNLTTFSTEIARDEFGPSISLQFLHSFPSLHTLSLLSLSVHSPRLYRHFIDWTPKQEDAIASLSALTSLKLWSGTPEGKLSVLQKLAAASFAPKLEHLVIPVDRDFDLCDSTTAGYLSCFSELKQLSLCDSIEGMDMDIAFTPPNYEFLSHLIKLEQLDINSGMKEMPQQLSAALASHPISYLHTLTIRSLLPEVSLPLLLKPLTALTSLGFKQFQSTSFNWLVLLPHPTQMTSLTLMFDVTHGELLKSSWVHFRLLTELRHLDLRFKPLPTDDDEITAPSLIPPDIIGHLLTHTITKEQTYDWLRPYQVDSSECWLPNLLQFTYTDGNSTQVTNIPETTSTRTEDEDETEVDIDIIRCRCKRKPRAKPKKETNADTTPTTIDVPPAAPLVGIELNPGPSTSLESHLLHLLTRHLPLIFPCLTLQEEISLRRVRSDWYRIKMDEMGSMRSLSYQCSVECGSRTEHAADEFVQFFASPIVCGYVTSLDWSLNQDRGHQLTRLFTQRLTKLSHLNLRLRPDVDDKESLSKSLPASVESPAWVFPSHLSQVSLEWFGSCLNHQPYVPTLRGLVASTHTNLKELLLQFRVERDGKLNFDAILTCLSKLSILEKLTLGVRGGPSDGITRNEDTTSTNLPPLPTSLTHLTLDVPLPRAHRMILKHLVQSSLVHLRILRTEIVRFDHEESISLKFLHSFPNLQQLELSSLEVNKQWASRQQLELTSDQINELIHLSSLTSLRLRSFKKTMGKDKLSQSSFASSLEYLSIHEDRDTVWELDYQTVEFLSRFTSLKQLALSGKDETAATTNYDFLSHLIQLEQLRIRFSPTTETQLIADALGSYPHSHLHTLRIWSELTSDSLSKLLKPLTALTNLAIDYLRTNSFNWIRAMPHPDKLLSLTIMFNENFTSVSSSWEEHLRLLTGLQHLDLLRHPSTHPSLVEHFIPDEFLVHIFPPSNFDSSFDRTRLWLPQLTSWTYTDPAPQRTHINIVHEPPVKRKTAVIHCKNQPGKIPPPSDFHPQNPTAATAPAPRLIGVEMNPGPVESAPIISTHTIVSSPIQPSTLFRDGIHSMFAYLSQSDWWNATRVCRTWSAAADTEPNRRLSVPIQANGQIRMPPDYRFRSFIAHIFNPDYVADPHVRDGLRMSVPDLMTLVDQLPNLNILAGMINWGSPDLTHPTCWSHHLLDLNLYVESRSQHPHLFQSIFELTSLIALSIYSDTSNRGTDAPTWSSAPWMKLSQLEYLGLETFSLGPIRSSQAPIQFPPKLRALKIRNRDWSLKDLPLFGHLDRVQHFSLHSKPSHFSSNSISILRPGDLPLILHSLPGLVRLSRLGFTTADFHTIAQFKQLIEMTFTCKPASSDFPPVVMDDRTFIGHLAHCPSLTHLTLEESIFTSIDSWQLLATSLSQLHTLVLISLGGYLYGDWVWPTISTQLTSSTLVRLELPDPFFGFPILDYFHRLGDSTFGCQQLEELVIHHWRSSIESNLFDDFSHLRTRLPHLKRLILNNSDDAIQEHICALERPHMLPFLRKVSPKSSQVISINGDQRKCAASSPENVLTTPPAAPLVGIELNPGPSTPLESHLVHLLTSHLPLIFAYLTLQEEIHLRCVRSDWYRIKIGEMGSMRGITYQCAPNCRPWNRGLLHPYVEFAQEFLASPIVCGYLTLLRVSIHQDRGHQLMRLVTQRLIKLSHMRLDLSPTDDIGSQSPSSTYSEPSAAWSFPSTLIHTQLHWYGACLSHKPYVATLRGLVASTQRSLKELILSFRLSEDQQLDFEVIFTSVSMLVVLETFELTLPRCPYQPITSNDHFWTNLPPLPTSLTHLNFDVPSPPVHGMILSHLIKSKLVNLTTLETEIIRMGNEGPVSLQFLRHLPSLHTLMLASLEVDQHPTRGYIPFTPEQEDEIVGLSVPLKSLRLYAYPPNETQWIHKLAHSSFASSLECLSLQYDRTMEWEFEPDIPQLISCFTSLKELSFNDTYVPDEPQEKTNYDFLRPLTQLEQLHIVSTAEPHMLADALGSHPISHLRTLDIWSELTGESLAMLLKPLTALTKLKIGRLRTNSFKWIMSIPQPAKLLSLTIMFDQNFKPVLSSWEDLKQLIGLRHLDLQRPPPLELQNESGFHHDPNEFIPTEVMKHLFPPVSNSDDSFLNRNDLWFPNLTSWAYSDVTSPSHELIEHTSKERSATEVIHCKQPPPCVPPDGDFSHDHPPVAPVPSPRLIGIETNPGPAIESNPTTSTHTIVSSSIQPGTLFRDGIHSIFAYLYQSDWWNATRVCRTWSAAADTEPNRQLSLPIQSKRELMIRMPPHYRFRSFIVDIYNPEQVEYVRDGYVLFSVSDLMTLVEQLPNLQILICTIPTSSTDVSHPRRWSNHLLHLDISLDSLQLPHFFDSIFELTSLTTLAISSPHGVQPVAPLNWSTAPWMKLSQLEDLALIRISLGPIGACQQPIQFPRTLRNLRISNQDWKMKDLPLFGNLENVPHFSFDSITLQPGDLPIILKTLPGLVRYERLTFSPNDFAVITQFKQLREITFTYKPTSSNWPPVVMDDRTFIGHLAQCPALTHLTIEVTTLTSIDYWQFLATSIPQLQILTFTPAPPSRSDVGWPIVLPQLSSSTLIRLELSAGFNVTVRDFLHQLAEYTFGCQQLEELVIRYYLQSDELTAPSRSILSDADYDQLITRLPLLKRLILKNTNDPAEREWTIGRLQLRSDIRQLSTKWSRVIEFDRHAKCVAPPAEVPPAAPLVGIELNPGPATPRSPPTATAATSSSSTSSISARNQTPSQLSAPSGLHSPPPSSPRPPVSFGNSSPMESFVSINSSSSSHQPHISVDFSLLQTKHLALQDQLKELEAADDLQQQAIKATQDENASLRAQLKELTERMQLPDSNLPLALEAERRNSVDALNHVKQLEEENRELETTLKEVMQAATKQHQADQLEIENLTNSKAELTKELATTQIKLTKREKQVLSLQQTIDASAANYDKNSEHLLELQKVYDSTELAYRAVKVKLKIATKNETKLQEEKDELLKKVETLTAQLTSALNIASSVSSPRRIKTNRSVTTLDGGSTSVDVSPIKLTSPLPIEERKEANHRSVSFDASATPTPKRIKSTRSPFSVSASLLNDTKKELQQTHMELARTKQELVLTKSTLKLAESDLDKLQAKFAAKEVALEKLKEKMKANKRSDTLTAPTAPIIASHPTKSESDPNPLAVTIPLASISDSGSIGSPTSLDTDLARSASAPPAPLGAPTQSPPTQAPAASIPSATAPTKDVITDLTTALRDQCELLQNEVDESNFNYAELATERDHLLRELADLRAQFEEQHSIVSHQHYAIDDARETTIHAVQHMQLRSGEIDAIQRAHMSELQSMELTHALVVKHLQQEILTLRQRLLLSHDSLSYSPDGRSPLPSLPQTARTHRDSSPPSPLPSLPLFVDDGTTPPMSPSLRPDATLAAGDRLPPESGKYHCSHSCPIHTSTSDRHELLAMLEVQSMTLEELANHQQRMNSNSKP